MSRTAKRRAKIWNEKICPAIEMIGEFIAIAVVMFSIVIVSAIIICAA